MIAHRGSVDTAPESTLAAMDQAVADHADRVTIDVRLTSDGVPVVVHDADLRRTTDAEQKLPGLSPWTVGSLTLAQIKTLDAGSWYRGGVFAGSRVLTLDELLGELGASPIGMTLEVKNPADYGDVAGIGATVERVLAAHPEWATARADGSPRLVVESFDWGFLDRLHTTYPDLPLVLLGNTVTPTDVTDRSWVREIDVRHDTLTTDTVDQARSLGIFVGTWTANSAGELQRVIDLGASGVTTDQPDLLRSMVDGPGPHLDRDGLAPEPPRRAKVDISPPPPHRSAAGCRSRPAPARRPARRIPWQTVVFQSRLGGVWRTVGTHRDRLARRRHRCRCPSTTTMRVRVLSGGRTSTERVVAAVVPPVVPPGGAPRPRIAPRGAGPTRHAGADPRVTTSRPSTWRAMAGRSWRAGCPVGRSALRMLQVSYWGFDGYRHRGTLVVAAQLGRPAGPASSPGCTHSGCRSGRCAGWRRWAAGAPRSAARCAPTPASASPASGCPATAPASGRTPAARSSRSTRGRTRPGSARAGARTPGG